MSKRYDSTVARIAGNILSGVFGETHLANIGRCGLELQDDAAIEGAVVIARKIADRVRDTEPKTAADLDGPR